MVIFVALIALVPLASSNVLGQTSKSYATNARFNLPASNASISFAVNGTYSNATLEGNSWVFTDLSLNQSKPMPYLEISARNSNMTVWYYGLATFFTADMLNYFAQGAGEQTLNMGIQNAGNKVDWVVFSNGTFETNGWTLTSDGTVTVTGLTGNITVIYFGFTNELGNSKLPFYDQHSVAIAVAITVASTVGVAISVNFVAKRRSMLLQSEVKEEQTP